jgi:hypothetical protein
VRADKLRDADNIGGTRTTDECFGALPARVTASRCSAIRARTHTLERALCAAPSKLACDAIMHARDVVAVYENVWRCRHSVK